jgi:hypothetical protein
MTTRAISGSTSTICRACASLLVLAMAMAIVMVACSSSAKPDPADVAAAEACQTFSTFLSHKATGQAVLDAAAPLIAGAAAAEASSVPGPKWAALGADIVTTVADINTNDPNLSVDGDKVVNECGSIPGPAKRAGGYVK